jgi:histone deacetylase complex regulatory component SIN3
LGKLVEKVANILQGKPTLFHSFSTLLPEDIRAICTADGDRCIDIVTIITPSGGEIYPISASAKLEEPRIRDAVQLRSLLLSDRPWDELLQLSGTWATSIMELLQRVSRTLIKEKYIY